MNKKSSSNTTTAVATTKTRWFCEKLPTVSSASESRKRKKMEEHFVEQEEQKSASANRVLANPNITKTQIAKINYVNPPLELGVSSSTQTARINFVQKRKERDAVIEDFKSMLSQLQTKSSPPEALLSEKAAKGSTIEQADKLDDTTNPPNNSVEYVAKVVNSRGILTAPNSFRRAQTEVSVERPQSLTTRTRSSNQIEIARGGTARTMSSDNRVLDSANKKCSYDPTAARRYMKAQQKRRRTSCLKPGQEDAIKKEEIKKRLEELKKQSRMIVSKNIKKQKVPVSKKEEQKSERTISPHSQYMLQPTTLHKNAEILDYAGQVPASTARSEIIDTAHGNSSEGLTAGVCLSSKPSKSVRTVQSDFSKAISVPISVEKSSRSIEKAKDVQIVGSNRRVGILRKPESKDHSFSHIADFSFEKENVAIEMLTPQIPPPKLERKSSEDSNEPSSKPLTAPISIDTPRSIRTQLYEEHENKSTQVQSNLSLVGAAQCETDKKEAKIQTDDATDQEKTNELPFWLRPSAVQVYPYNFIHAVRRKLLSIAEPTVSAEIIEAPAAKNEATSTRDLSATNANLKNFETPNRPLSNVQSTPKSHSHAVEQSVSKSTSNYNGNIQKSQTISDFNSNLSSISLQAPISNTVSEVSSLKSESAPFKSRTISTSKANSYQDKDDTTVSSSVFSSPEKLNKQSTNSESNVQHLHRNLSPLSLERVEKLKIKSKVKTKPNGSENVDNNQNLDFNKLLSDFNHGLSQVIEANEQLKSTLDRSQLILSPKGSTKSQLNGTSQTEVYTTDFEELTHATNISNKSVKQVKRKLLKTTAPLLISPPKTEYTNVISNPELQLDLASVTSSVHSSELLINSTTGGEESSVAEFQKIDKHTRREKTTPRFSPHAHEERLATIDQLKENLRRMIKESQENRKVIDKDNSAKSSKTQSSVEKRYKSTSAEFESNSKHQSSSDKHKKLSPKFVSYNSTQHSIPSLETLDTKSNSGHTSGATLTNTYDVTEPSACSKSSYKTKHKKQITDTSSNHTITETTQKNTHETSHKNNKATNAECSRVNSNEHNRFEQNNNKTRGEFIEAQNLPSPQCSPPPPGYTSSRRVESPTSVKTIASTASLRTTCSGEIANLLKVADLDLSRMSSCDVSLSESSSFNYSNVGLYEKLIKSEITKSEHLASLLKMREKALLDRTKGQVAWLQVQKERCKSKGLLVHIADIRKKQRAILIKMSKEREEIKRLLQSALSTPSDPTSSTRLRGGESAFQKSLQPKTANYPPTLLPLAPRATSAESRRCRPRDRRRDSVERHSSAAPTVLRATHELESSASVEALLRQREDDLRRRREYCERLLEWHRKLDEEELEVYNLERQLFNHKVLNGDESFLATKACCSKPAEQLKETTAATTTAAVVNTTTITINTVSTTSTSSVVPTKRTNEMERRLKEIDKSLRELNSISATTNFDSTSLSNGQEAAEGNLDFVRTTGSKLNKLWRRLTSQQLEKYEPNRRYKLCKADLERLYEEAKLAVLTDFSNVEERSLLLEKSADSSDNNETSIGSAGDLINAINAESTIIEGNDVNKSNVAAVEDCEPPTAVPSLNLNFSTSPSAEELENSQRHKSTSETFLISKHTTGDYSPSNAERNFQDDGMESTFSLAPTTSATSTSTPTPKNEHISKAAKAKARSELIKRNLQKFLRITNKPASNKNEHSLERSLSDTEIGAKSPALKNFAAKSNNATWTPEKRQFTQMSLKSPQQPPSATPTQKSADTLQSVTSLESYSSTTAISKTASSIVECINIPSSSASSTECSSSRNFQDALSAKSCSIETSQIRPTVIQSIASTAASISTKTTSQDHANHTSNDEHDDYDANKTSIISSIIEPQQITQEFDTKSNEIAAKLNEISEAVARLSQSNSLVSVATKNDASTNNSTKTIQDQTEFESENANETQTQHANSFNNTSITDNNSDFSYSTSFESPIASKTDNNKENSTLVTPETTASIQSVRTLPLINCGATPQSSLDQSALENDLLDIYELDMQNTANETLLDEVSMPFCLDSTFDTSGTTLNWEDIDDVEPKTKPVVEPHEMPAKMSASCAISTPTKPQMPNNSSAIILKAESQTPLQQQQQHQQSLQQQLMPDIINELEIRRCQQILIESEQLRQYEQVPAVPYVFVREIPNKPPPPYCPPAHGSPMTTIFPSEERIKDITFRRTHELYCEILKTDHVNEKGEKLPSVLDEKITNIYERIVLDICREYLDEHNEVLNPQSDPTNFHSQLAFFNPPDRLRCIQESIYKDVRRCLGMDKTTPKRTPVYSIYGQRAKRDHIGQIIIQEMYEEDEKWCSFYREEDEVLDLIIEEMIGHEICKTAKAVLIEEGVLLETTEIDTTDADETDVLSNCSQVESLTEITQAAENSNISISNNNDSSQALES